LKVLILEDDDLVAQGLVRGLGYLGCPALHVSDIAHARAAVAEESEIGMALIDVGLDNGESGEDFFAWMERERPHVCRVLISGLGRPAAFVDDPPRQLFLRKPFGQRELVELLETVQPQQSAGSKR
jgi:DNA-binding NtrC family response regulator